ncbi:type IV secretory system conjugative DNA transfer family protein [Cellulosimicrobium cellulans]|uniref:type IV secretory system conjugative DNA transfer family protein n=1 Tax=Cellulosimicrobium cellulans TaxID=1710 RepID=UPI0020CE6BB1|nr:TraM recognition domain-containing protein [Cellulosimicrobium cellulans]
MPAHRPYRSLSTSGWILVMWLTVAAAAVAALFHASAWIVAAVTGNPGPAPVATLDAIRSTPTNPVAGYDVAPGPAPAVYTVLVVLVLALVIGGFLLAMVVGRAVVDRRTNRTTPRALRDMHERQAAAKARDVLKGTALAARLQAKEKISPNELLVEMGSLRGVELYAQHEDSALVVAPPRSGKTMFYVVGKILDAPGPVVATGTKNDIVFLTAALRAEAGRVHVLDFSGITGWPEGFQWDPVVGCADPEEALERGRAWASADPGKGRGGNAEWFSARAGEVLAYLLHAAALKPGGNVLDVVRWAADFTDNEPITVLRDQGTSTLDADPREAVAADAVAAEDVEPVTMADFGTHTWADLLQARTQSGADDTSGSLQMTLSGVLAPLTSPKVLQAMCPGTDKDGKSKGFDVEAFLDGRNTLYLLSGKGSANVAPLITTLTDVILRTAVTRSQKSPGGRLWPPLRAELEEAANVAPLPDLPSLMSDSGGRGISVHVIVQSHAQMDARWGSDGADAIRAAATAHLYLPGIKEDDVLKELSERTGRYRAGRVSYSSGHTGGSVSTSSEWENVMTPEDIRTMPVGTGLLAYRNLKLAHVNLTPWWKRADRKKIEAGLGKVQKLTGRRID